jgi:hypothetical protein
MKEIKYTTLYWVCENFCNSILLSSGSGTVINYGSGSAMVRNYITVTVPLQQKVTVPTVPVPQHWQRCSGSEERLMRMEMVGMVGMVRVGLRQSIAALIIHLTSLLQVQSARFCFSLTLADSNVMSSSTDFKILKQFYTLLRIRIDLCFCGEKTVEFSQFTFESRIRIK